jgi:hypothetical protein
MKPQENNVEYVPVVNAGIHIVHPQDIDFENLLSYIYSLKISDFPVRKSNIGGYQSKDDLHCNLELSSLNNYIIKNIKSIFNVSNPIIDNMWFNISKYSHKNGFHNHYAPGIPMSGIFYLKAPKNCGDIIFLNPLNQNYSSQITPRKNTLLLFPSTLYHMVDTNMSYEDRVSIAFNISNIFN